MATQTKLTPSITIGRRYQNGREVRVYRFDQAARRRLAAAAASCKLTADLAPPGPLQDLAKQLVGQLLKAVVAESVADLRSPMRRPPVAARPVVDGKSAAVGS